MEMVYKSEHYFTLFFTITDIKEGLRWRKYKKCEKKTNIKNKEGEKYML